MNLDDLRAAQVDERGTDSLRPLRPSFYEDAAAYLSDLRDRRDRLADQVDDPFDSAEVRRLTDELETAEEVVEAIYDRRVGKLVKRASLAAAGMPTDEEGLTAEERELFRDLVERIESNRSAVLEALEGAPSVGDSEPASEPTVSPADGPGETSVDPADVMGAPEPDDPADEAETASDADERPAPDGGSAAAVAERSADEAATDTDRLTVRITAAVGEIYGVDDRVYTLDAEDVVTLPTPNAQPLLDRGAAQRVD